MGRRGEGKEEEVKKGEENGWRVERKEAERGVPSPHMMTGKIIRLWL